MHLSLSSRSCAVASACKQVSHSRSVATRAVSESLVSGAKAAADARAALSSLSPLKSASPSPSATSSSSAPLAISQEAIVSLEHELDQGASLQALRRFNDNLRALSNDKSEWHSKLRRVMHLLAHNLESFNPAFAACVLQVQLSIGATDYEKRDAALKLLIRPLAGEYGMRSDDVSSARQGPTHRELFQSFYEDLLQEPLGAALAEDASPRASADLLGRMMRDILGEGAERALSAEKAGAEADSVDRAAYALGYNLAIEYLADYEKTWMLDSFRALDEGLGLGLKQWAFLEVHAEGEAEHAAIGHAATAALVDAPRAFLLRAAMRDHDADFARFYNVLADVLE